MCFNVQCFVNHVLTCILALMIIFSHVYLLRWSHAFTFTRFDIHMPLYSHASMFTCFDDHTLLCSHALMIVCSYVYMLRPKHVHLPKFLKAHMFGHFYDWCSYVNMLCWTHEFNLCAMMIECFHVYML